MDKIINMDLVRNPYNWIIITLMVITASLAIKFLFVSAGAQKDTSA